MEKRNISKTTVYNVLNNLVNEGLIKKTPGKLAIYSITPAGKARVHNIKVVCHVFEINLHRVAELGREVKLNNWTAYYVDLAEICRRRGIHELNATIKINNAENRTAVLHLSEFYASSQNKASLEVHNTFNKIRRILQLEGTILDEDWVDLDFIYAEYAFETDEPLDPGTEIMLNRPAKDIQGKETKQEIRVWVDESKGKREIETNDSDYYQNRLLMPERVAKIDEIEADVKETKENLKQIKSAILNLHAEIVS